jgi:hypothetical protein
LIQAHNELSQKSHWWKAKLVSHNNLILTILEQITAHHNFVFLLLSSCDDWTKRSFIESWGTLTSRKRENRCMRPNYS